MAEDILPRIIKGYRQDPKTGKPETLPTKLDRRQVMQIASGLNTAVEFGMPEIGLKQLPNKILLEGRSDAGTNEFNYNNRYAKDLHEILLASKVPDISARYAAAVLDKQQVADRLGIPFELAWNGTGKSALTGKSGAQHAAKAAKSQDAASFPQNADLVDTIRRAAAGQLSPQENIIAMGDDKLQAAILGISPDKLVRRENDRQFYSPEALSAADRLLQQARSRASLSERKDSKLMFDADVLAGLTTAYSKASGVEPPKFSAFGDTYVERMAADPLMKYIIGTANTPAAPPEEPSLLDKFMSLFK